MVQLDVFEDGLESDSKEARTSGLEITTIDEEDPQKLFTALKGMLNQMIFSDFVDLFHHADIAIGSPFKEEFMETLKFLLDFSTDASTGPKIWTTYSGYINVNTPDIPI